ncbi:organic cation transporter protein-like [Uloborus diversus]|nr:organic cation transporter protein-like [Uloborus diversus]
MDLLKYPNLRRSTFHQFFIWFSTSLVYYALTWSTNELEGDPYWNFFLAGLVEFPATLSSMYIAKFYGRRKPLSNASFVAGAILAVYSGMVARQDSKGKLALFMMAKFCTVISFTLLYVYSSELFPTAVRGVGVGYCSTAARVGAILAPFVAHMGGHSQPHLCYWAYGLLCATCGLCILLLPETSNRKLPDTLLDGEQFHRNDVIISCKTLSNP